MKPLFFIHLFVSLIITTGQSKEKSKCNCVDVLSCGFSYSNLIMPRSLRQKCSIGKVCCRPEYIIKYPNQNLNSLTGYNPNSGKSIKVKNYDNSIKLSHLARFGELPWTVSIFKKSNTSKKPTFISTGFLINQKAILTAARTVNNLHSNQVVVRLAQKVPIQNSSSQKYLPIHLKVKSITIKDDFDKKKFENDVAILCLIKPIKFNSKINSIFLPEKDDFISDSSRCEIADWSSNKNNRYRPVFKKSYQNLIPINICNEIIEESAQDSKYYFQELKNFICVRDQAGRNASCKDKVSPLTCTNKRNQQVLVGISSRRINCHKSKKLPRLFTNIRNPVLYEWIKKTVQECTGDYFNDRLSYSKNQMNNHNSNLNYNSGSSSNYKQLNKKYKPKYSLVYHSEFSELIS